MTARVDGRAGVHVATERLVLRQFTEGDIDDLTALDADPAVMRFISDGRPTPREEIERVLEWWLRYPLELPGLGYWAAEERATGQFLGWFHLRPGHGHPPDEPELGYRLRRSSWGRGYATEGCRALIDKAFAELPVRRILAETMVVHTASRRVMEKAGLRPVEFFRADWPVRIPGDEHGDVRYALDRESWEALRRAPRDEPTHTS